jgi:hypothetical protein
MIERNELRDVPSDEPARLKRRGGFNRLPQHMIVGQIVGTVQGFWTGVSSRAPLPGQVRQPRPEVLPRPAIGQCPSEVLTQKTVRVFVRAATDRAGRQRRLYPDHGETRTHAPPRSRVKDCCQLVAAAWPPSFLSYAATGP